MSQEFRVLLILIILVTSMFFCYSLIRLCMTTLNPSNETDWELQLPQMVGPGGYANPETPIRVALARDEEAVGIQSEATKYPPPAYGLWRESVVRLARLHMVLRDLLISAESGPESPLLAAERSSSGESKHPHGWPSANCQPASVIHFRRRRPLCT